MCHLSEDVTEPIELQNYNNVHLCTIQNTLKINGNIFIC